MLEIHQNAQFHLKHSIILGGSLALSPGPSNCGSGSLSFTPHPSPPTKPS